MCGLVGEISVREPVDGARLERMAAVLDHRGPDENGVFVAPDGRWGLAHRRLNILDPEGGRQPFVAREHGLTLVFNGEVYEEDRIRRELAGRWEFRSRSDTEVILALYAVFGLDFVRHLRGEFAFALIDEKKRRAVLVRDRFGLKPLFYMERPRSFIFASEIKGLFQDERVARRFSPEGLAGSVTIADIPGRTLFEGVLQVPNAHMVVVSLDTLETRTHQYWDAWKDRATDVPARFEDQVAAVRAAVDEAIDIRLRADVPVGVYLSGGIDSSAVTAGVAKRMDKVHAYGMSYRSSDAHDEYACAQAVADRFENVELHEIPITPEHLTTFLPRATWHMERPHANPHTVAKMIAARTVKQRLGVVLTGDGGDEAFCGYATFWLQNQLQKANYDLATLRSVLRDRLEEAKDVGENRYYLEFGAARALGRRRQLLKETAGFVPADLATSLDTYRLLKSLMRRSFYYKRIHHSPGVRLASWIAQRWPSPDEVPHGQLLQYLHLTALGPEYIAAFADRTENAGSIEGRLPLFDHKVVELGAGLPFKSKVSGDREKHVFREVFRGILPDRIIDRRKQAFLLPTPPRRSKASREVLDRYLAPNAIRDAGVFGPARVAALRAMCRLAPRSRILNIGLNIVLTTQVIHEHFIRDPRGAPPPMPGPA